MQGNALFVLRRLLIRGRKEKQRLKMRKNVPGGMQNSD
jgi:hypothetical protein